ncbi:serine/threonine kinase [Xylaria cf. heliscus]|nr:serine/threonine kinase [Xylaria cf. heliscus]
MLSTLTSQDITQSPVGTTLYGVHAFVQAPERNPDSYGSRTNSNRKKCSQLAADFFKSSVNRARERRQRQNEMDERLQVSVQDASRREQIWSASARKEAQYLRFLRTRDKPNNYSTVKVISNSPFGEVKLVRKKVDGKVYAMKSLIKTEIREKVQFASVRTEPDILAESNSPWVAKLFTTFQDSYFLYMLIEFLPGGNLMMMLIKHGVFSEDTTRFYMAECIQAIGAVHKLGLVHRDIRPENILLDRGGHIKLIDFGLSTRAHHLYDNNYYQQFSQGSSNEPRDRDSISINRDGFTAKMKVNEWRQSRRTIADSTAGTHDCMAPEIFTGQGYSFCYDWWSLGIIMFECLVGWPPFYAEDGADTCWKIVNWRQSLYFPDEIRLSIDAENLIRRLVCNTENRIGCGGTHELKAHPFFRGVLFDDLRRISAPFEPCLDSDIDTTYFPTEDMNQTNNSILLETQAVQQALGTSVCQNEDTLEMSLPFIGYSFKRFDCNFQ